MKTQSTKTKIKILLVDDGSSSSQWITQNFGRFIQPENSEIYVIRVLPARSHPISTQLYMGGLRDMHYPILTEKEFTDVLEGDEQEGNFRINNICELLQSNGLNTTPVLRRGDTVKEIIKYSDNENVDFIVVESNKRNIFQNWRNAIFITKLMNSANCSVMIMKNQVDQKQLNLMNSSLSREEIRI